MTFPYNIPLFSAICAIILAQLIKVFLQLFLSKRFKPDLAFSTGGMPSSHSAAVTALATSIGLTEGFSSGLFAVSCVFGVIVMFDSSGVRRQAGEQAILLNQLQKDFQSFAREAKVWNQKNEHERTQNVKELLGHQPIEVFFGGLFGVVLSIILFQVI